jgi:hypothetical protein
MPLGNGTLGAAVWAANGFIARLNRIDTFPDRKSTGQVTGQTFGTLAGVTAGGRSVVASTPDATASTSPRVRPR